LASILVQSLKKTVRVVWRIVVNYILWVMRVDLVDVLSKLASWFGLDLLDFLETAGLHEGPLGLQV
jgi:hypothetical protein